MSVEHLNTALTAEAGEASDAIVPHEKMWAMLYTQEVRGIDGVLEDIRVQISRRRWSYVESACHHLLAILPTLRTMEQLEQEVTGKIRY